MSPTSVSITGLYGINTMEMVNVRQLSSTTGVLLSKQVTCGL